MIALGAMVCGARISLATDSSTFPGQPVAEQATVVPGPVLGGAAGASAAPSAAGASNDLHPRPLGVSRDVKAAPGAPTTAQPSAAATLWDNPTIRTGGSLVVVLALIVGLAAITKKVAGRSGTLAAALGPGGKAPAGLLEVLGRYPLSRGQTLILLKVDQRVLLLAQTTPRLRGGGGGSGGLATLCEITDAEEVASILVKAGEHEGTGATAKFSALLHAFDRTHARAGESEPDHTELDLRTIQETDTGDRSELWNEQAAPYPLPAVVHKFPAVAAARPGTARVVNAFAQAGGPLHSSGPNSSGPHSSGTESFSSIRERLHALRGEAHR